MSCLQREQAVFEKPLSALGKDRTDLSRSQLLKIHLSFLPHLPQAHPTASLKAGPSEDLFLLPPVSQFTCLFFFFSSCVTFVSPRSQALSLQPGSNLSHLKQNKTGFLYFPLACYPTAFLISTVEVFIFAVSISSLPLTLQSNTVWLPVLSL